MKYVSALIKALRSMIHANTNPKEIAYGFSIGILVGMTPFIGIHTFIALFFATVFRKNKVSALAGIQVTNIFTAPLIYPCLFYIGHLVYPVDTPLINMHHLRYDTFLPVLKAMPDIFIALVIGGLVAGVPLAVLGYMGLYYFLCRYRQASSC